MAFPQTCPVIMLVKDQKEGKEVNIDQKGKGHLLRDIIQKLRLT
jgi:hypothetical protein